MLPNLTNVTICAIDSINPTLAGRAIDLSLQQCRFGEAILFTDQAIAGGSRYQVVNIPRIISREEYSRFVIKSLFNHIKTDFVLIVQWDGYVLSGAAWISDFLEFDYVGARWHWFPEGMRVGNGGFSLRSRKLLSATSSDDFVFNPAVAEDLLVCHTHRAFLEMRHQIKIADESIADQFSYERSAPESLTFGFHGLFNMWRHVDDAEMSIMVRSFDPRTYKSKEFVELQMQYLAHRKYQLFDQMYTLSEGVLGVEGMQQTLTRLFGNSQFLERISRARRNLERFRKS